MSPKMLLAITFIFGALLHYAGHAHAADAPKRQVTAKAQILFVVVSSDTIVAGQPSGSVPATVTQTGSSTVIKY